MRPSFHCLVVLLLISSFEIFSDAAKGRRRGKGRVEDGGFGSRGSRGASGREAMNQAVVDPNLGDGDVGSARVNDGVDAMEWPARSGGPTDKDTKTEKSADTSTASTTIPASSRKTSKKSNEINVASYVVCNGSSYFQTDDVAVLNDNRLNPAVMSIFEDFEKQSSKKQLKLPAASTLAYEAITGFFWGQSSGVVLEIGAMDGVLDSQSHLLAKHVGWNRILVEGSPLAKLLKRNAPDALSLQAVVCAKQKVHFAYNAQHSGILDFMHPQYLKDFYSSQNLTALLAGQWEQQANVFPAQCLPLHSIIRHINMPHINLLILDTNGSELSVLLSLRFHEVLFDVIVVAVDAKYHQPRNDGKVHALLANRGYVKVRSGKYLWFVHQFFQPCARPAPGKLHKP